MLDLAWLQSAIISFGLMKVIIRVLCKNVGGCLNSQQGGTIQDTEAEWICCEENMFYLELTEYGHKDPHFGWSHFLAPTGAQERLMCLRSFVRSSVRPFVPNLSEALNLHLFFIITSG